ncbi:MAG TPA: 4Fe-4S ferredoxin, partial [Lentisphaeria bacterium]|nr:4Fe-4S ferredoxin [Lentisphaeria bacterium]
MKKANVYFTNMRVRPEGRNLQQKLAFLIRRAGMDEIDFKDRFAAIKIHFGEAGNLSFLRPNFARTVADEIKARGGKPFLTDCNTLYVGSRKHALEHIETAYINGFTPYSTGCHIIIGDGLKGTDDIAVPVPNGEFVREAKIGRAVMDADIFISLNHFKGHEMTGFGGAIKNIGMG